MRDLCPTGKDRNDTTVAESSDHGLKKINKNWFSGIATD